MAKLNLNTASKSELAKVKSIGPERAQRIVDYRQSHGPLKSVDELGNVQGFTSERIQEVKKDAVA